MPLVCVNWLQEELPLGNHSLLVSLELLQSLTGSCIIQLHPPALLLLLSRFIAVKEQAVSCLLMVRTVQFCPIAIVVIIVFEFYLAKKYTGPGNSANRYVTWKLFDEGVVVVSGQRYTVRVTSSRSDAPWLDYTDEDVYDQGTTDRGSGAYVFGTYVVPASD